MDYLSSTTIEELLTAVGEHLAAGGNKAAIAVVGGSTLVLGGWVERTTQDVDVIAQATDDTPRRLTAPDPLSAGLREAIQVVARDYGLPDNWMNTEVGAQWRFGLPEGFAEELEWREYGPLAVGFAGRQSLIALKLFASADGGPESVHVQDLIALAPTPKEMERATQWVVSQDAGEYFPRLVAEVSDHVRRNLQKD